MDADHHLHESDPRVHLIDGFPTDGAIEFLNRVNRAVGRSTDKTKDDASKPAFGPTDLPEHFPWPRADG